MCVLVILIISHFDFEDRILVVIAIGALLTFLFSHVIDLFLFYMGL